MEQQTARTEQIKKKVQDRISEIRKKEEEFARRREKVRLFQTGVIEEERKSIEPRLNEINGKLLTSKDRAKHAAFERSVQPRMRNMAVQDHIFRFRTEEADHDDSKYKAFCNEENSLRNKTEKKRKEVQKAVEEENYKRMQKHN